MRLIDRAGWVLAGALGLALLLVAGRAIEAGPLDPPGPVASTMRALDGLTPSWSLRLASDDATGPDNCNSTRFECVLGDAAVLDKETGLVWQMTPSSSTANSWFGALFTCNASLQGISGLRGGWHLPTIEEFSTLLAFSSTAPFANVSQTDEYWTSTTDPFDTTKALTRIIGTMTIVERAKNTVGARVWCVRGGATPGS